MKEEAPLEYRLAIARQSIENETTDSGEARMLAAAIWQAVLDALEYRTPKKRKNPPKNEMEAEFRYTADRAKYREPVLFMRSPDCRAMAELAGIDHDYFLRVVRKYLPEVFVFAGSP